jgi:hypothetical protein
MAVDSHRKYGLGRSRSILYCGVPVEPTLRRCWPYRASVIVIHLVWPWPGTKSRKVAGCHWVPCCSLACAIARIVGGSSDKPWRLSDDGSSRQPCLLNYLVWQFMPHSKVQRIVREEPNLPADYKNTAPVWTLPCLQGLSLRKAFLPLFSFACLSSTLRPPGLENNDS